MPEPAPDPFPFETPQPTASRPLMGQNILLVEDSITASESLRLMCCRSGARVRRANCLTSAHRHLSVYRPSVLLVDMVLPDGSGADLLAHMSKQVNGRPVILGMSAHLGLEAEAIAAGADGFIAKPFRSLDRFQCLLLEHLPEVTKRIGPRRLPEHVVAADPDALRQDFATAANLLRESPRADDLDYTVKFISALARENEDSFLAEAVAALEKQGVGHGHRKRLESMVKDRLGDESAFLPV